VVSFTPLPLYPPPRKSPRYPFYRRLGGPQSRSGLYGKFFTLPGLELPLPLVVQPVASSYTDRAIGGCHKLQPNYTVSRLRSQCPVNLKSTILDNRCKAYCFLGMCEASKMETHPVACDMFISIIYDTEVHGHVSIPAAAMRVAACVSFHTSRHCSLSGTRQGEGSSNLGSSRHVATLLLDFNWPSAVRQELRSSMSSGQIGRGERSESLEKWW
jgi:hypothetical protein